MCSSIEPIQEVSKVIKNLPSSYKTIGNKFLDVVEKLADRDCTMSDNPFDFNPGRQKLVDNKYFRKPIEKAREKINDNKPARIAIPFIKATDSVHFAEDVLKATLMQTIKASTKESKWIAKPGYYIVHKEGDLVFVVSILHMSGDYGFAVYIEYFCTEDTEKNMKKMNIVESCGIFESIEFLND